MAKKEMIIQNHHEQYADGEHPKELLMVRLRKGEHRICTMLKRWCCKNVSVQFIRWLRYTANRLEMDRKINKIDLDIVDMVEPLPKLTGEINEKL